MAEIDESKFIGRRIVSARGFLRMDQREVGEAICVSVQIISNWENGRHEPNAAKKRALCLLFGCTFDYLLGTTDDFSSLPTRGGSMSAFRKLTMCCRKNRGLSQAEASKITGIPQTTISAYERGVNDPKLSAFEAMADAYGVSLDFLTGRTDETTTDDGGSFVSATLNTSSITGQNVPSSRRIGKRPPMRLNVQSWAYV